MVCVDKTMSTLPPNCGDINNVPRLPGSTKLQKEIPAAAGGGFEYEPWRTQENHMSEWLEILHKFTKPGDTIWDPCCGTMPLALAAFRLNRCCIVSDRDEELVKAATFRVKFYQHWARKTFVGLGPGNDPPPAQDGLNPYRFHQIHIPSSALGRNQASLPWYSTAPKHLPDVGTEAYDTYCNTMGVKVMPSSLGENAGNGLFLIAPKKVGDIHDPDSLRVPYYGTYSRSIATDRCISLQYGDRNADPIYIIGNEGCPAAMVNDPMVRPFVFVIVLFVNPKTI